MANPLGTLVRLAPELRIQIYNLVLDSPDTNRFEPDTPEVQVDPISYENTKHMALGPALFRTSRLIASETIPLYLRSHKFTVRLNPDPQGLLLGWMQHVVGKEYWHCLHDVFLWCPAKYAPCRLAKTRREALEVMFWSHHEIMMVYRADRAQSLKFDVFSRPLNPRLALTLTVSVGDQKNWAEAVQKVLDWLWLDAMKLGRQLMLCRVSDSRAESRFRGWALKIERATRKDRILELTQMERKGCDWVAVT